MESYLLPARVECYAGSRAEEEPRAVWVEGLRLEVAEVVDRWYQGSAEPASPAVAYFRVRTADGEIRLLRHDEASRAWYLVERARQSNSQAPME